MMYDLARYGQIRISRCNEVRRTRVLHTRFSLMVMARQVIAETRNEGRRGRQMM